MCCCGTIAADPNALDLGAEAIAIRGAEGIGLPIVSDIFSYYLFMLFKLRTKSKMLLSWALLFKASSKAITFSLMLLARLRASCYWPFLLSTCISRHFSRAFSSISL